MTADEHLQVIVGQLIIQMAMLKAEVDRLKAEVAAPHGHTNERVPS